MINRLINDKSTVDLDYILIFDDDFLYPIKNYEKSKDPIICNKYDMKLLRNVTIKQINSGNYQINLEFLQNYFSTNILNKEYKISSFNARKLTAIINSYVKSLGMGVEQA